ncbi:uncharacterized protein LOC143279463 [Babylonia areolata]|uniref:uncharacterized protein LOC143279463 n=1 Tax=Babylonia areolata TaxID=304850 RepID=UPI003FD2907B
MKSTERNSRGPHKGFHIDSIIGTKAPHNSQHTIDMPTTTTSDNNNATCPTPPPPPPQGSKGDKRGIAKPTPTLLPPRLAFREAALAAAAGMEGRVVPLPLPPSSHLHHQELLGQKAEERASPGLLALRSLVWGAAGSSLGRSAVVGGGGGEGGRGSSSFGGGVFPGAGHRRPSLPLQPGGSPAVPLPLPLPLPLSLPPGGLLGGLGPRDSLHLPLHPWLLARHSHCLGFPFTGSPEAAGFLYHWHRKPKRIRTAFSPGQLLQLEQAFEKNHYVVGQERKELADRLSLSETQVKVWFQNRRTKYKRMKAEEEEEENDDSALKVTEEETTASQVTTSRDHIQLSANSSDRDVCCADSEGPLADRLLVS